MFKDLRTFLVRQLVELNEQLIFNRRLIRFYKKTFGNSLNTVIDVGSNLGQTINMVLKINPDCKIYAFEPNPALFKKLSAKYAGKKNIRLFQLGISDQKGEKTFYENILHSTSTLEDLNYSSEYLKKKSSVLGVIPEKIVRKTYTIQVITLSDFIAEHCAGATIDLLKIDTEGHEYFCLQGLFNKQQPNINYIQLESHNDDMYVNARSFTEIQNILKQNNFTLLERIKHGFGDFDEVIFKNSRN